MTSFSFDSNIVIDALRGHGPAQDELHRASRDGARAWISRIVWIEVMSKGKPSVLRDMEYFLAGFGIDEIDTEISSRAAALRRERARLKSPDAIVLASALVRGRILITRNTKDFPANMLGIRVPYTL